MSDRFFLAGVPKAGTTILWSWLRRHPDLFLPDHKEPGYFATLNGDITPTAGPMDRHYWDDVITTKAAYDALMQPGQGKICGDASPLYALSPEAPAAIAAAHPKAKIILVLREPGDRAFSQFAHHRRDGLEPCATLDAALDAEQRGARAQWSPFHRYLEASTYRAIIARFDACFDPSQIHIAFYDDLCTDPAREVARICRHLGVADHLSLCDDARLNVSREATGARSNWIRRTLAQGSPLTRVVRRALPSGLRGRLKDRIKVWNAGSTLIPDQKGLDRVRVATAADLDWLQTRAGTLPPAWRGRPNTNTPDA